MPVLRKLDGVPVRLPKAGSWPAQDVFINWRLVESSNVAAVGWDNRGNMYVRYGSFDSPTYIYHGVSRQRAVYAAYAASTGKYINNKVKPTFGVLKLSGGKLAAA